MTYNEQYYIFSQITTFLKQLTNGEIADKDIDWFEMKKVVRRCREIGIMDELHRHSDFPFDVEYITMDPGYAPENRAKLEENAKVLGLPLRVFETNVFRVASRQEKSPCYLCARMRRGHLYNFARELGCNKIALGHHMTDAAVTVLMGMIWGSQISGMLPRLKSTNFEGMELIRPLIRIKEDVLIKRKIGKASVQNGIYDGIIAADLPHRKKHVLKILRGSDIQLPCCILIDTEITQVHLNNNVQLVFPDSLLQNAEKSFTGQQFSVRRDGFGWLHCAHP